MSTQPLFDFRPREAARATDPVSSVEAAEAIEHVVTRDCMEALSVFYACPSQDFDDFELEVATGIKQTSIGKRRYTIWMLGYVERMEKRPSSSGLTRRNVYGYRITDEGMTFYARETNR